MATSHFKHSLGVSFASSLLSFSLWPCATAAPVISQETKTYPVMGKTASAIRKSINQQRQLYMKNKNYDAQTAWTVRWKYNWKQNKNYCYISKVSTAVDIVITVPEWAGALNGSGHVRKQWTDYMTALMEHEYGHADFGIQAAKAVESAVSQLESSCETIAKEANMLGHKALETIKALEIQYDKITQHGRTQGAVFPKRKR